LPNKTIAKYYSGKSLGQYCKKMNCKMKEHLKESESTDTCKTIKMGYTANL
jgi:hypothetical protein